MLKASTKNLGLAVSAVVKGSEGLSVDVSISYDKAWIRSELESALRDHEHRLESLTAHALDEGGLRRIVHIYLTIGYVSFTDVVLRELRRILEVDPLHLPASRSGLLASYRGILSSVLASLSGSPPPRLPGPVADMLSLLADLGGEGRESSALRLLRARGLKGDIEVEFSRELGVPVGFTYRPLKEERIPLTLASSGVSELAPLYLYIKYFTAPNTLLVVEEPEAHLHPELQALISRVLVRLVNEGVKVLVSTHSDILLNTLSDLVRLSSLGNEEVRELRYSKEDVLSPGKLAVYLFKPTPGGVVVEEVPVTENGVEDKHFTRIARTLYDRSLRIYYRLQEALQEAAR